MGKLYIFILPALFIVGLAVFFFSRFNTPEYTTSKFYNWYLENRLPKEDFKNHTSLSTDFVLYMTDIIANEEYVGDPFLCTHVFDKENAISIDKVEVLNTHNLDEKTVLVNLKIYPNLDKSYDSLYKENERYYFMTVGSTKLNSNWKLTNLYCVHVEEVLKALNDEELKSGN